MNKPDDPSKNGTVDSPDGATRNEARDGFSGPPAAPQAGASAPEKQGGAFASEKEVRREMGQRIRRLRTEARLSQQQLGDRLGVSRVSVSLYESGERAIHFSDLPRLARAFGVTVGFLFGEAVTEFDRRYVADGAPAEPQDKGRLVLTETQMRVVATMMLMSRDAQRLVLSLAETVASHDRATAGSVL